MKSNNSSYRVTRAGGWHNFAIDCRAAYRYGSYPVGTGSNLGCRLALAKKRNKR